MGKRNHLPAVAPLNEVTNLAAGYQRLITWPGKTPTGMQVIVSRALAQALHPLRDCLRSRGGDLEDRGGLENKPNIEQPGDASTASHADSPVDKDVGRWQALGDRLTRIESAAAATRHGLETLTNTVAAYRQRVEQQNFMTELDLEFAMQRVNTFRSIQEGKFSKELEGPLSEPEKRIQQILSASSSSNLQSHGPAAGAADQDQTEGTARQTGGTAHRTEGTARRRSSSPLHVSVIWGTPQLGIQGLAPWHLVKKYQGNGVLRTGSSCPPEWYVPLPAPEEMMQYYPRPP